MTDELVHNQTDERLWDLLGLVELTYHPALAVALLLAVDAVVSWWRSSPLDGVVRRVLAPGRRVIRDRLVTFEMVSPRDAASTARPTPVTGFVDASDDSTRATGTAVTMWGSTGSF